jgi:hypothetical protein
MCISFRVARGMSIRRAVVFVASFPGKACIDFAPASFHCSDRDLQSLDVIDDPMSKHETPMIVEYWKRVGGVLIEEFQLVKRDASSGPRRADAVILLGQECKRLPKGQRAVSIEGKDVIVVQAKAQRLGMYLMGQGVFSAELIKRFKPNTVQSVILCTDGDATLMPMLAAFPNVSVEVMVTRSDLIADAGSEINGCPPSACEQGTGV